MREKYLEEMSISIAIGALLAIVLCNILPGIDKGLDFVTLFLLFWLGGTAWSWQMIAAVQWIRERITR